MRISRLHTPLPLSANSELTLSGDQAHYLGKVLRLSPGAELLLFNGDGQEYHAVITALTKHTVVLTLGNALAPGTESRLHSVLALGISRGERMDYAIQKSTELGVSVVVPLFTEHCEVKLQGERVDKRQAHWQQIAISACEQSGRVKVPQIAAPQLFSTWLPTAATELKLVLDHTEHGQLPTQRPTHGVSLLIGPEGGLSAAEVAQAKAAGFLGIALGNRVLRTETAPVAALSVLQYLWG
jgi:16S rRNA (uracil1498-N3)-methyltransferase